MTLREYEQFVSEISLVLPSIESMTTSAPVAVPARAPDAVMKKPRKVARAPKPKRQRPAEFDPDSGEWVDVRRFDRMPVTVENAKKTELADKVPHGTYFVSLAHKRIDGIVQLHERWLKKTKNQCSEYAAVQKDLMEFFERVRSKFQSRYTLYTTHPQFDSICKTRKRALPKSPAGVK